ncbi:PucR family transcriptional regulator [Streptoalloteichus tenebrarius]|uniref:PucR family transcriptional regulator n=1 Tax=Streptoalloteichus tenebrarius (strain ATCC 17920 / DSM 40477 / JCM 4838 / CBS 697.72 / NBRC 16177 / NCIMB 11028 / NRRL B-12390 / A12253. 1 / ISP 5477) TaxID=1933 RepID=UPI0020A36E44|nr:helix-turn-helix domain-containing protein [Streptoalloteichus tenebrarius]
MTEPSPGIDDTGRSGRAGSTHSTDSANSANSANSEDRTTRLACRLLAALAADGDPRPLLAEIRSAEAHVVSPAERDALRGAARDAERLHRRMRGLAALHAMARAQSAAVERAAAAHDRLAGLVLAGGGVTAVAQAVVDVLGGALLVRDGDGVPLAVVGEVADLDALPPPGASGSSSGQGGDRACRAERVGDLWLVPATAGDEVLGDLVLAGRPDLSGPDLGILERAGMVAALLLLLLRTTAAAEERVRGELLSDLLADPGRDLPVVQDRARRLGVNLDHAHCVVVAEAAVPRQRLGQAAARHARLLGGLGVQHRGRAVLLLPGRDAGALARRCAWALSTALRRTVTAGAAGPVRGPSGIPAAHQEAERCLRGLVALGRTGEAASAGELGFVGLLLADRADPGGFVRATLGAVLDYDSARGTELVRTLRAYFAAGRSPGRAKDLLNVHVNTVVQRLERVTALLGADWRRPDRLLQVELAVRLLDLVPEPPA